MKKKTSKKKSFKFPLLLIILLISFIFLGLILIDKKNIFTQKSYIFTKTQKPSPSPQPTLTPIPSKAEEPNIQATWGNQVRIPILMYHYIGNNPKPEDKARDSISLGPDRFEEQMKYLKDNGYTTITLDTLYPALKNQVTLPNKTLILTFDDGYMDFYYNAYPILQKYGMKATVFIPTALMNQGYYLTWEQIKDMSSSGLITYGAHGVNHYHMTTLSAESLDFELAESKKVLQEKLGIPINFFAYPYGSVDTRVIKATKKAGFIGAVGTWASKIQSEGTTLNMPRMRVGNIDLPTFISLL